MNLVITHQANGLITYEVCGNLVSKEEYYWFHEHAFNYNDSKRDFDGRVKFLKTDFDNAFDDIHREMILKELIKYMILNIKEKHCYEHN